jgi:hypothetical protein
VPPPDWDLYWSSLNVKQQRNLSRRQSHAVESFVKKMEEMETLFGASVLANIRFPNGRQQSLYTLKVGEAIQFAETSEGQLLTTCFKKIFINVQSNKDI